MMIVLMRKMSIVAFLGGLFGIANVSSGETQGGDVSLELNEYDASVANGNSSFILPSKTSFQPGMKPDEVLTTFTLNSILYRVTVKQTDATLLVQGFEEANPSKEIVGKTLPMADFKVGKDQYVPVALNNNKLYLRLDMDGGAVRSLSSYAASYGVGDVRLGNGETVKVGVFGKGGEGIQKSVTDSCRIVLDLNGNGIFEADSPEVLEVGGSVDYYGFNYTARVVDGKVQFVSTQIPEKFSSNNNYWVVGKRVPQFSFTDESGKLRNSRDLKNEYVYISIVSPISRYFADPSVNRYASYNPSMVVPVATRSEVEEIAKIPGLKCVRLDMGGALRNQMGYPLNNEYDQINKVFATWTIGKSDSDLRPFLGNRNFSDGRYTLNFGNSYAPSAEVLISPDGNIAAVRTGGNGDRKPSLISYIMRYQDAQKALAEYQKQ